MNEAPCKLGLIVSNNFLLLVLLGLAWVACDGHASPLLRGGGVPAVVGLGKGGREKQ